jgi:hypothetical protein
MSVDSKQIALILLAAVVAASGCTQNNTSVETTQTTGVKIDRFSTFPNNVFGGSQVQLQIGVKNTGGATAESVSMQVFNLPEVWQGSNEQVSFGTLRPPQPEDDIPAVPRERTVTLGAPEFDKQVQIPYDVMGRLSYEYETTGVSEIKLMGFERFRQTEGTRSEVSVDNTGGPIQLDIRTRTPIVFFGNDDSASRLCVIVRNKGPGTVYLPSQGQSEGLDKVELSVRASSEFGLNPTDDPTVTLVEGHGVQCYEFTGLSGDDANIQTTVPVRITAEYGYFKEASSTVTVTGKP